MANQAELMGIFNTLIANKVPVRLYNTYRGLPLEIDTNILDIEQGNIATRVYGYPAVGMALEGQTHMHVPRLPGTLRATVIEIDIKKKRAVMNNFTYIESAVGHRQHVRVEPTGSLKVKIYDGSQQIAGNVEDISSEGMCITTSFAQRYGLRFEHNKEVYIDFKLPHANKTARARGIITRLVSQDESYLHRLGVKIYSSSEVRTLLDEYISWRQRELLNEMEKHYLSLSRKKTTRVS